jgi:copper(I)-binding protein
MTISTRRCLARVVTLVAAVGIVAALLAACSAGGPSDSAGGRTVEEAWARTAPKTAGAGAAYLVIKNTGNISDALVGASSPAATTSEVHETYAIEAPMGSAEPGASVSTMMGMRPVPRVEIPAGGSLELKPGSYHIMLIDLKQELKVGESIEITLTFEGAGPITVKAEVRED